MTVAIKQALGDHDFGAEPGFLRGHLQAQGFIGRPLTSGHVIAVRALPPIHEDPLDRIPIAQAASERLTFLTTDSEIAGYPGDIAAL